MRWNISFLKASVMILYFVFHTVFVLQCNNKSRTTDLVKWLMKRYFRLIQTVRLWIVLLYL